MISGKKKSPGRSAQNDRPAGSGRCISNGKNNEPPRRRRYDMTADAALKAAALHLNLKSKIKPPPKLGSLEAD
jgi:hypothetical protein